MQQKYLEQYNDLYDDFHLVKLPLLEEEVRGTAALKNFSKHLIEPYRPTKRAVTSLEEEVSRLQARCMELEQQLLQKS